MPPAPGAGQAPAGWGPGSWAATAPVTPSGGPGVPGAPGLEYAGVGTRFVAYLVDGILLVIVAGIIVAPITVALGRAGAGSLLGSLLVLAIDALYFAGLWASEWRATLGMRLFRMQIGNAMDGRKLTYGQALKRWVAFGTWLPALIIEPRLAGLASLALFVWFIALLITTASSPTRQGLHDRFAETAIVRPVGAGGGGLVVGCIVIFALLALVAVLAIVALIIVGAEVSTILSNVGDSI
jgi:uncharacterized RDD family membrane protein YckC